MRLGRVDEPRGGRRAPGARGRGRGGRGGSGGGGGEEEGGGVGERGGVLHDEGPEVGRVVVEEGEEDLGAGVFVWCFFFVWGVRGLIKRGDVGVWGRGVKCIWGFGGWGWG